MVDATTAARRARLVAALGFVEIGWRGLKPDAAGALERWLYSWIGVGDVVTGMTAQGFDWSSSITSSAWRATFYPTGIAHSIVHGTAYEPTPWRAVQRAAWQALTTRGRNGRLTAPTTGFSVRRAQASDLIGVWLGSSSLRHIRPQPMLDETPDIYILREQARAVIEAGKLPVRSPDRVWGGPGVGAPCAICDLPVETNETEFEIQFAHNGGLDKFHVHMRCFAAWELERAEARS